jgi:hypothetical protein
VVLSPGRLLLVRPSSTPFGLDGIHHGTHLGLAGRLFALLVGDQFHTAEQTFAANVADDGVRPAVPEACPSR